MADREPGPIRPIAVAQSRRAEPTMQAFERLVALIALAAAVVLTIVRPA